jgi:hypothetical protein
MWDVDPVRFFEFLLQVLGTHIAGTVGLENPLISSFIDGWNFSPDRFFSG